MPTAGDKEVIKGEREQRHESRLDAKALLHQQVDETWAIDKCKRILAILLEAGFTAEAAFDGSQAL